MWFLKPLAQTTEQEWMDTPGHSRALIDDNLNDLRLVNRLLGGTRLTVLPVARLARQVPRHEVLRVLDLATGGADIPRAVVRWAQRDGRRAFVVASDVSLQILTSGREHEAVPPGMAFVVAAATALPFATGAFHITTSSLSLHHMLAEQAVAMLSEMRRCSRTGVVVNDLVRSWLSYAGAVIVTRLGSSNALTIHDGPLSVLRAFTVSEMRNLARMAGLRVLEWDGFLFYRVSMTAG